MKISKKNPYNDSRKTMIALHSDQTCEFKNKNNSLRQKETLLFQLENKLKSIRNKQSNEYFQVKKEITKLKEEIDDINLKITETQYYTSSSEYLKNYNNSQTINKGEILNQYIYDCHGSGSSNSSINKNVANELFCTECNCNKEINHKEALSICPSCGYVEPYQDNDICNEFSDEIEVGSQFSYKRINHFTELISMLLARESSSPPDDVIKKLSLELMKDKIKSKEEVTPELVKQYLKKLGLNKQYEHCSSIIHKICGTAPPNISKEFEATLKADFEKIQKPFEKCKPPERTNFLSYAYVFYKLCERHGKTHLLSSFPLLKSREKLHEQDQIWAKICKEVGWVYIPSC